MAASDAGGSANPTIAEIVTEPWSHGRIELRGEEKTGKSNSYLVQDAKR
jgi:hypothetical protein